MILSDMTRRTLLKTTAATAAISSFVSTEAAADTSPGGGRLKQSVSRWCYKDTSLDDLCKQAVRIGLKGIDLVTPEEWPTIQKYGLVPSMTAKGAGTIPDAWNRLANHERLEKEMQESLTLAAAAHLPNVITFSGNRKGMPDAEGLENCAIGLNKVKKMAEDKGVVINVELLNSKVNHKDYMCDHTAWGVELMKKVNSPNVKLLYDIYHMQIMEGDIIRTIRDNFKYIGHFHTGGVPGRHEIDGTQELDYHAVANAIADLGYQGFIAHEFVPVRDPIASLEQAFQICKV